MSDSELSMHFQQDAGPLRSFHSFNSEGLQVRSSQYLLMATCALFSWDVLINFPKDYRLFSHYGFVRSPITYLISRFSTFIYLIISIIFQAEKNMAHACHPLQIAIGVAFAVALSSTTLIFLFRIKAVFKGDAFIIFPFAILWIAVAGTSLTAPFGLKGTNIKIGSTEYCATTDVKTFFATPIIISAFYDTIAFIFISWRLLEPLATPKQTYSDRIFARLRASVTGDGLATFSCTFLRDGQRYFLITLSGNILCATLILIPRLKGFSLLPSMFICLNLILRNIMTGRVYRKAKLGCLSNADEDETPSWDVRSTFSHPSFIVVPRTRTHSPSLFSNSDVGSGFEMGNIRESIDLRIANSPPGINYPKDAQLTLI
ncbi:hypothetical protein M422DRAFT_205379 [Sphaerobolus stellatus SS14]|nr:hypothetical protein M422DRAFT_205379 [Sphaerobolus stellatus SS14]